MIIFECHLGYIQCDTCGNGNNELLIRREDNATQELYTFEISSRCYGDKVERGLDRAGVMEKLEEWDFLASTRAARHHIKDFRRRGFETKFSGNPPPPRAAPPESNPHAMFAHEISPSRVMDWFSLYDL